MYKTCTSTTKCGECGSDRHPSALHPSRDDSYSGNNWKTGEVPASRRDGGETTNENVSIKCTQVCGEFAGRSCSKTLMVKVHHTGDRTHEKTMYAIIDDQSNRTLARPEFFDAMDVPAGNNEHYTLVSCAGSFPTEGRCARGFTISSMDDSFSIELPSVLECNQIPNSRTDIPTPEIKQYHHHLKDIPLPPLEPDWNVATPTTVEYHRGASCV